jgi:hypothetical protein
MEMLTEKEVAMDELRANVDERTKTSVYGYPAKPSEPPPAQDQAGHDEIALVELYNFS